MTLLVASSGRSSNANLAARVKVTTADADGECSSLFTSQRGSPPMPVKSYRTLHGIRGVAALCIVVLHSPRLFGSAPVFLALAVDLFFALSGFVLTHAYEDRLRRGMTLWRSCVSAGRGCTRSMAWDFSWVSRMRYCALNIIHPRNI